VRALTVGAFDDGLRAMGDAGTTGRARVPLFREGEGRGEGDQISPRLARTGKRLINFIALTLSLSLTGEGVRR
jgi:hypothetical protein